MALDHSGDEGLAGEVDDAGAGGSGDVGPDRSDPVAVDEDGPAGMRLRVHAVEDLRGPEEDRLGEHRRCKTERRQQACAAAKRSDCSDPARARAGESNEVATKDGCALTVHPLCGTQKWAGRKGANLTRPESC